MITIATIIWTLIDAIRQYIDMQHVGEMRGERERVREGEREGCDMCTSIVTKCYPHTHHAGLLFGTCIFSSDFNFLNIG